MRLEAGSHCVRCLPVLSTWGCQLSRAVARKIAFTFQGISSGSPSALKFNYHLTHHARSFCVNSAGMDHSPDVPLTSEGGTILVRFVAVHCLLSWSVHVHLRDV